MAALRDGERPAWAIADLDYFWDWKVGSSEDRGRLVGVEP